jgi:NAD(P)-dependent dehydrogenase (short-subunit alcohol dehydrogenase family)
MSVNGKIGIVTEAGSGLGEAGAKRLAREGAALVLADRNADAAERVAREISASGGIAEPFAVDVTDHPAVEKLIQHAITIYGGLHRQHGLHRRNHGARRPLGLLRLQARHRRPHPIGCRRVRQARNPGQCRCPGPIDAPWRRASRPTSGQ